MNIEKLSFKKKPTDFTNRRKPNRSGNVNNLKFDLYLTFITIKNETIIRNIIKEN